MTYKFAGQDAASWVGITNNMNTGKAHVSHTGEGVSPSGASKSNKAESAGAEDSVRTMQNLMSDLGTQLSKPEAARAAVEKLKEDHPELNIDVKYIQDQALKFSRTAASARYAAAGDGIWGANTKTSLLSIKNFVDAMKIPNVIISEGTGPSPNQTMKSDELITIARENINNLSRLFSSLNLTTSIGGLPGSEGMVVVDSINPTLPEEGVSNPFGTWGGRPVTMANLASFYTFFEYIQGLTPSWACIKLEDLTGGTKTARPKNASNSDIAKLAQEILDKTIIRIAQQPGAMAHPGTTPTPTTEKRRGHCVNVIDNIIDWFSDRANEIFSGVYSAYEKSLPSPRPDRKGKVGTMYDAQLGKFYAEQMQKISDAWDGIRDAVIDALRAAGDSPVVTLKTLRDATGKHSSNTGKAHQKRNEIGGADNEGETIHTSIAQPPLNRFVVLSNFAHIKGADELEKLSRRNILPELNLQDWSQGAWTTLAQSDVAGDTDAQKYANFGPWAGAVRDFLEDIYSQYTEKVKVQYDDWRQANHNEQIIRAKRNELQESLESQRNWLNRWINKINGTIGTWQREFKEKMERARRGL